MGYEPEKYNRRSMRMKGYDYSLPGAYFVTLLASGRKHLFWKVNLDQVELNEIGKIVEYCWLKIPNYFDNIKLDEYVIMPDHLHGIIFIEAALGKGEVFAGNAPNEVETQSANTSPLRPRGTKKGSLGAIIQNFKLVSTRFVNKRFYEAGNKIWQRNYYDRIIRNEREFNAIRQYIRDNPLNWEQDVENPDR